YPERIASVALQGLGRGQFTAVSYLLFALVNVQQTLTSAQHATLGNGFVPVRVSRISRCLVAHTGDTVETCQALLASARGGRNIIAQHDITATAVKISLQKWVVSRKVLTFTLLGTR